MTSILSPEDLKTLEKNGLLKPSKRTPTKTRRQKRKNPSTPTKETQPTKEEKPKRETFKTTILRIPKESKKPIKRPKLVKLAIKENLPKSKRPEWVYHDIIRRLKRDRQLFIGEHQRMEHQVVSLEPIPQEEQQK